MACLYYSWPPRSTLEVKSVRVGSNSLPQKPVRLGVRCVGFPPLSAAWDLAFLSLVGDQRPREVRALRVEARGGRRARAPGLVSVTGAHTLPERTDKSSGKLEKTFPFFPLTFYDNSYFQMKGEKSQERNSQMSQKGKKKKKILWKEF